MQNGTTDGLLPVGTIIAFAGTLPSDLQDQGWCACDGTEISRTTYQELWAAIGIAYGWGDQSTTFNLPQLQGMFLRGVAHGSTNDPSATSRTSLRDGGNAGDSVGSYQVYGTAPPNNSFEVKLSKYDVSKNDYDKGKATRPYKWNSDTVTMNATGGDHESRPVNKYVYFIIKMKSRNSLGRVVQPPVGSVMPFATTLNPDAAHWTLCDGKPQPPNGEWAALYTAIQFAHGETKDGEMVLPDYRGYFLRGVSGTTEVDPDREARHPPYDGSGALSPGNGGNQVGSVQKFATALPTGTKPLTTSFTSLPKDKADNDGIAGAIRYLVSERKSTTVDLTESGGDAETRPNNLAIDWYIRAR